MTYIYNYSYLVFIYIGKTLFGNTHNLKEFQKVYLQGLTHSFLTKNNELQDKRERLMGKCQNFVYNNTLYQVDNSIL
jgi:hypothetical protein